MSGAPTVRFLDSGGRWIEDLESTRPEDVEAQMRQVARSHPRAGALRALPDSPGEPWDWIRERVADLGSDDFETRQRASEKLAVLQRALRAAIDEASRSEDAEVRARAEELRDEKQPRPAGSDPIDQEIVIEWLQRGVKTYWIRRQIQKKGATFSLTEVDVERLRKAGADQDLIDVMLGNPAEGR